MTGLIKVIYLELLDPDYWDMYIKKCYHNLKNMNEIIKHIDNCSDMHMGRNLINFLNEHKVNKYGKEKT